MKPIVLIAIIAVAAMTIGIGSLNNTIQLNVQELGVGETDLVSPIDNAKIGFGIEKVPSNAGPGTYKNIIRYCLITNTDDVAIPAQSLIYCKLTDEDGNVAAEGTKFLTTNLGAGISTKVTINDPQLIESQVQNIHDVILVVQGPKKG